jgi:hypothetical protein
MYEKKTTSERMYFGSFCIRFLAIFRHIVFVDSFLIPVKELGLLTNPVQWINGFGCCGILYILYCKQ